MQRVIVEMRRRARIFQESSGRAMAQQNKTLREYDEAAQLERRRKALQRTRPGR